MLTYIVILLLITLAAVCNAGMDTITFHSNRMIFPVTWKDTSIGRYVVGYIMNPWHYFKSIMLMCFIICIVIHPTVSILQGIVEFIFIGVWYCIVFNLCFDKIFIKK